ncbi:MAG: S8 family serine peptidase [Gemmatimonadaceae bacterium]
MAFKRFGRAALIASLPALAACADEIPTTGAPTSLTRISSAAALTAATTKHIVHFNGDGVPSDFASQVAALGGSVDAAHEGAGMAVVDGLTAEAAAQLAASSGVSAVDPDNVFQFIDESSVRATLDATDVVMSPDNPALAAIFPFQWNMRAIGANVAWAAGHLGSPAVKVAILDTGIDYLHPDLAGHVDLANSTSFVPSDDALVAALFPGRHPVTDLHFHGTHVAATASSNGFLAAGVTSRTTLMGVKVIGVSGAGSTSALLNGMVYAVNRGANVLNLSLAVRDLLSRSEKEIKDFEKVTNRFFQFAHSRGVTVVVAAGNEAQNLEAKHTFKGYCDSKHVTCVSATGPTSGGVPGPWANIDAPATYTNFGVGDVHVAAPGGNANTAVFAACSTSSLVIPQCRTSLIPLGLQGTSQATPHVSGLAALLIAQHGTLQPGQLRAMIENSADDLGPKGKDAFYGSGRINVRRALGL